MERHMQATGGFIPVLAPDTAGCDAVGGMIPLAMSDEIMPPFELAATVKKLE